MPSRLLNDTSFPVLQKRSMSKERNESWCEFI